MIRRSLIISLFIWLAVSVTEPVSSAFASGTVYYGPYGSNYSGCYYCSTYGYSYNEACIKSDATQDIYYIYHVNYGYAGYCDKSGGGGVEPRPREMGVPPVFGSVLWPMLFMAIAGFILGMTHRWANRQ